MSPFKPALAAALLALVASVTASNAQFGVGGPVRKAYGAWAMVCDKPAGASGDQCSLRQDVFGEDRPDFVITVGALKTADHQAQILRVIAPLGIYLPPRLGLYVDGKDLGRLEFTRCIQEGCYADTLLDGPVTVDGQPVPLLAVLAKGKSALFYVFPSPEKGIGFTVDLNGFAEGFAALP